MTKNQAPQEKSEALSNADKTIRNWLVVFCASAALSIVSALVGPQNVLVTAIMFAAAAVTVWKLHKREAHLEPAPIPVENNVVYLSDRR